MIAYPGFHLIQSSIGVNQKVAICSVSFPCILIEILPGYKDGRVGITYMEFDFLLKFQVINNI